MRKEWSAEVTVHTKILIVKHSINRVPHLVLSSSYHMIFLSHTGGHTASKRESQLLNNKGIVIFALGLGSLVNSAEINALASEPNHVFHYSSFRQMLPTDNGLRIALALCSGKQQPMYAGGSVPLDWLPFCTTLRERCFWIAIM